MELTKRHHVVNLLEPGSIAIELGVAEGVFSHRLLQHGDLGYLYSVDMWAGDRGHDVQQYKAAITKLHPYRHRNSILKMRFDEALDLFSDEYFDFIYIDGYAHTGQEDGKTLDDWWPKLKVGGVFSGDDYSPAWPSVQSVVNAFVKKHTLELNVINCGEPGSVWSEYPTWWIRK